MAPERSSLTRAGSRGQDITPFRRDDWLNPSGFWNAPPWQMLRRMQEDMDRLFTQFLPSQETGSQFQGMQAWAPTTDISEDDKEWRVEIDLPGVKPEDVNVEMRNDQLHIRAEMRQEEGTDKQGEEKEPQRRYVRRERRYGVYERTLTLPDNVDENAVRCDFRDGVLTCHLPKSKQALAQTRQIPVNTGTSETKQPVKKAA